jgi:hypothetical protein
MLASIPASMVNQKPTDLGIPNRFKLSSSRFSDEYASGAAPRGASSSMSSNFCHRSSFDEGLSNTTMTLIMTLAWIGIGILALSIAAFWLMAPERF